MATLSTGPVELHYEDSGGDGRPVVLVHGWPLSAASWTPVRDAAVEAGYRVVAYDRRGFGRSAKPGDAVGYDYDALTADLAAVVESLDLRDMTLVGFSMGGGEVARYAGTRDADRVRSVAFVSAIPPCLLKDPDHPDGALDLETVRGMQQALRADPPGFLDQFLTNFFSAAGELKVTEAQRQEALAVARQADVQAAAECIESWTADFTADLATLRVPTLVVHGDSDAIVPFEKSGQRTHEAVDGSELHVVRGGPHGLLASHPEEVTRVLLGFLTR
ncbi:MAG TPA: alpha/beta hydrolase [Dermatophilaceae bacterium]|nr:alpha/beta hydrolase [Dermatophilaceae bacterium]